jgi:hypothetical protein
VLTPYSRAFTSKLHTFLIGKNKKTISVHAEIVSQQSKGLDRLINGKMAEASSGVTEFEDVLEDTFIRFCQFAYVGDYETPAFTHHLEAENSNSLSSKALSKSSLVAGKASKIDEHVEQAEAEVQPWEYPAEVQVEDPPPDAIENNWNGRGETSKKKSKTKTHRSNSSILRQEFDNKFYDTETAASVAKSRCKIRGNELLEEDYTPVFLGHARLYVFAEKWGIDALKTLTLSKLHKTLVAFKIYEARRGDIVELVRFAYSNENTPDLDEDVDALRDLVTHYVTCELKSLTESPGFLALLEQPGLFSRDLVKMMMK